MSGVPGWIRSFVWLEVPSGTGAGNGWCSDQTFRCHLVASSVPRCCLRLLGRPVYDLMALLELHTALIILSLLFCGMVFLSGSVRVGFLNTQGSASRPILALEPKVCSRLSICIVLGRPL